MDEHNLYDPRFEHDACGIGTVVDIRGRKSHRAVDDALRIVERLGHRAGKDAAGETGDGVGILLQIPHDLFREEIPFLKGFRERTYGVGMFFFPRDDLARSRSQKTLEFIVAKEGMTFLGWRDVPVRPEILGQRARSCMPRICQCFVKRPENVGEDIDFDRRLYVARRVFEQSDDQTYVCSFSCRTLVYKGMFLVDQLRRFYDDLRDERCRSAIAMVHSRFSTNTMPSWERAHPNRLILHNGEINTIRGNVDRMLGRDESMSGELLDREFDKILPAVDVGGSDSAMLDNTLEFLMMNGMELPKAVMITIPEPWRHERDLSAAKKDMYHYYATMMEPWDGPAAILFSDGDIVGATLDRNGLRPCRYLVTDDDLLILASEVGTLELPPEKILRKSRLTPGRMLLIDTKKGKIIEDDDVKSDYASRRPYGEWLDQHLVRLEELPIPNKAVETHSQKERNHLYRAFGYHYEELKDNIIPMALNGGESIAAMGADIPLSALSDRHPLLFGYFKQMFAQVTNPPIDAIREKIVTDTAVYVGSDGNLLEEKAENCAVLELESPILSDTDMMRIRHMNRPGFRVRTISLLYYKATSLKKALDRLFVSCDRAYREGANILILSDRGVDENHVAIPSLLAVSALEQYLIRTRKRTAVSVILESAEPRDIHHFATLLGFGARAVNPYFAHEVIGELVANGLIDKDPHTAMADYDAAILGGIVHTAAKMGISTLQSYQSAQIFEIVGLSDDVVETYFTHTVSRVGGIGLKEIAEDVEYRHHRAFDPLDLPVDETLDAAGVHCLRSGGSEDHLYDPETILALREAAMNGDYRRFKEYTARVNDENRPHTLRSCLAFAYEKADPIPIDEVESVDSIVKRFKTGAMSYGSISEEAHECLAEAMNALGARSNSGEGGEAPERLNTAKGSAIKQVASGRFGVTGEYLLSAKEIQIKMAQGAKPGEGGHLPGKKVYPWVAKTRNSTPGVSLISPPPHHDIYSIEDLAQLIYDLKNANPAARISVKLAAEAGVGTIACGVAKAGAQVILISGFDGGTGAAPRTSIHNTGLPWELGVAETHQTLIQNGLRGRVAVETDGKLMSGRDVAIACLLGAEEFGFATAPLITMGCVMMRVCNRDTCPVGIATQNPKLRKYFRGKPEYVIHFMRFVAEELREIMADLGLRTVEEMVGRTDLLKTRERPATRRASALDLSRVLNVAGNEHFDPGNVFDFALDKTKDRAVLMKKLKKKKPLDVAVSSTDRTFGALFGSALTKKYGNTLNEDDFVVNCRGGGGQSFGAFIPKGLTLRLCGDANDYFGKGLSGGKLAVFPPAESRFAAEKNIIIGNVALYGATSGKAYIRGVTGERFCVRNSGAVAVAEGVGDHGCEYMTGGRVVILGPTGRNFAAGMSGGIAYVFDEDHDLYLRVNKSMVVMEPVSGAYDARELRQLIDDHVRETGSELGQRILDDFENKLPLFKKIIPKDYAEMLRRIAAFEEKGLTREQAEAEAFDRMKNERR
ncbi:MAG: glutamate synthase large subunit [Bacillota bacterium]|jgi:glutamate synthase (NADPH/NADH) large chain